MKERLLEGMKWRSVREGHDVSNEFHNPAGKLRGLARNTVGVYSLGICNGLTVLPNESSHKAGNKTDHECYQDSYHPFSSCFYVLVGPYVYIAKIMHDEAF